MADTGKQMQAERERLERDGFASQEVLRLQPKRVWYREDGSEIGLLPVDLYHQEKFRARGFTLHPHPTPATQTKHYLGFPGAVPFLESDVKE